MIYTYTITCISSTETLYFSYTDIDGNNVQFYLTSGKVFSYSASSQPYLIAPFPTNFFNYSITIN